MENPDFAARETWAHSLLPLCSLCDLGSSPTPGSEERSICFQGLC